MLAPVQFTLKLPRCVQTSERCAATLARNHVKSRTRNHSTPKVGVEKHALKDLFPWKTRDELAAHLASNVVYNKDGLIVINKPYGIPLRKSEEAVGPNESLFAIEDILSPLAYCLREKTLLPAKVGEKFSSGLSIFVTDSKLTEKVQKCYRVNRSDKINTFTYQVITIGKPYPEKANKKVALGFFSHKDVETHLPIILKDYSGKQVKKDLVKLYNVDYQTLKQKDGSCSLVELNVTSANKHFLRVLMAHQLAPILGDHLFGNRVQDIMGKRIAINPLQADRVAKFQKIPKHIMSSLRLDDPGLVPTCLHLSKIVLSRFNKDTSLELSADPPPYFDFIMRAIGLKDTEII